MNYRLLRKPQTAAPHVINDTVHIFNYLVKSMPLHPKDLWLDAITTEDFRELPISWQHITYNPNELYSSLAHLIYSENTGIQQYSMKIFFLSYMQGEASDDNSWTTTTTTDYSILNSNSWVGPMP